MEPGPVGDDGMDDLERALCGGIMLNQAERMAEGQDPAKPRQLTVDPSRLPPHLWPNTVLRQDDLFGSVKTG